jgi:hypothetical protein
MTDKDRVFQILCDHFCSIMDGWVPYPSTCIAGSTGWRLYYVRKLLKELKQEGLITSDLYVETGEDLDRPILVRGYTLTPAGMKTQAYKLAWEKEREICKQCFKFDIGPIKEQVYFDETFFTD